jgi:hypothetical protein
MLQTGGYIYNTLIAKKKERFDIILEPLQAFIQLSLLSFTPINTKINIYNNILYIQIPGWKQPFLRTYYNDSKNDLFYLFNVIQRFTKFYSHLEHIKNDNIDLLNLLKNLSTKGIDNLLQTYRQTDTPALLHTLNIYKNMLNEYIDLESGVFNVDISSNYIYSRSRTSSPVSNRSLSPTQSLASLPIQPPPQLPPQLSSQLPSQLPHSHYSKPYYNLTLNNTSNNNSNSNIDNVFIKITSLYTNHEYIIIFNILLLIQKNPNNYLEYIDGLNKILEPINKRIQKWIVDNIVY